MRSSFFLFFVFWVSASGCADKTQASIDNLPIAEELSLMGLSQAADVVIDNRGMVHIYAVNAHDALLLQGYFMARDRMAQMEFLRRAVQGRLSEVITMLDQDKSVRLLGFGRQAQATYDSLAADASSKQALDAFSLGVNAYIEQIKNGQASLPGILPAFIQPAMLTEWTGVDTLALARYQTFNLSFSGWSDIGVSTAISGIENAFPANSDDERLRARHGILHDLWPLAPAENAFTSEGFFGLGTNDRSIRSGGVEDFRPDARLLKRAQPMMQTMQNLDRLICGYQQRCGSNNWVVHGTKTQSGNPLLANDPHLALGSPPVWWANHINTRRAGGDLDVMGVSFAGTFGITLGFNRHVAWGATVTNYDVTDVYQEFIETNREGQPAVRLGENLVEIETITETIGQAAGPAIDYEIEWIAHHGPIIPETRTEQAALSFKWVGFRPSNEAAAFWAINQATRVDQVESALLDHFKVGSQNFVAIDSAGDILWSTQADIPIRDQRALAYDPDSQQGINPTRVLPGTGEYEWQNFLDPVAIPKAKNPASGYLCTANQDPVGVTQDGNPFNDEHYIGAQFTPGYRQARLLTRLNQLMEGDQVTPQTMSALQGDAISPLGTKLAQAFVQAFDNAKAEHDNPGTHTDLSQVLTEVGDNLGKLEHMRDRLSRWTSYDTPAAVEDTPTDQEIQDSVATTIFNVSLTRLTHLVLGDECQRIGTFPGASQAARTLQWAVLEPARLVTFDESLGDTVLWDDLATDDRIETRDERLVRAMLEALLWLEAQLSTDMDNWRWGKLHTIRFEDMFGLAAIDQDVFSIPPPDDPNYPNGFPRHGDNFVVDASSYGLWSTTDFSYAHGPSQRLVVEMTPTGPKAYNALPGGNQHDPEGPHHADEAEYWRRNLAPALAFEEEQVVQNASVRYHLNPL